MINMKIEVNEEQPLNEIVNELERLGYHGEYLFPFDTTLYVEAYEDGVYDKVPHCDDDMPSVTLAELKEM